MTTDRTALVAHLEKTANTDSLREMPGFATDRLLHGAQHAEQTPSQEPGLRADIDERAQAYPARTIAAY